MIVHKLDLVIFLLIKIFITIKLTKKIGNKLMSKMNILLYLLDILRLIINFYKIKSYNYIHRIISNIYYFPNFKRKDHTSLKTSYNKS